MPFIGILLHTGQVPVQEQYCLERSCYLLVVHVRVYRVVEKSKLHRRLPSKQVRVQVSVRYATQQGYQIFRACCQASTSLGSFRYLDCGQFA